MRLSVDDEYQLAREQGPDLRERRLRVARRAKVCEFLTSRNFWHLLRLLAENSGSLGFLTLAEAERIWKFHRAAGTRIDGATDEVRLKYILAKYFNRLGPSWL